MHLNLNGMSRELRKQMVGCERGRGSERVQLCIRFKKPVPMAKQTFCGSLAAKNKIYNAQRNKTTLWKKSPNVNETIHTPTYIFNEYYSCHIKEPVRKWLQIDIIRHIDSYINRTQIINIVSKINDTENRIHWINSMWN